MPTVTDIAESKKVYERALSLLSTRSMTTPELAKHIYPHAQASNTDPDYGRLSRQINRLKDEGKIKRSGNGRSPWVVRAKPTVADLPERKEAKAPKAPQAPTPAGDRLFAAYLIRDIESKLAELKALL